MDLNLLDAKVAFLMRRLCSVGSPLNVGHWPGKTATCVE